jgi:hypothetical protein
MSIKLIGNERLVLNKQVLANQRVSAVARVRHNYPEGSEQGVITISSDFDGELYSQEIPLEDGIITLTYSGSNDISQNVKLEIAGGDNNSVYATLAMLFSGGATLNFQSIPAGSVGNNITIKFQSGGERDIDITLGSNVIITVTYESGDTFYDVFDLLDEAADYITYSYSGEYNLLNPVVTELRDDRVGNFIRIYNNNDDFVLFNSSPTLIHAHRYALGNYKINQDKTLTEEWYRSSTFNHGGFESNRHIASTPFPNVFIMVYSHRYYQRFGLVVVDPDTHEYTVGIGGAYLTTRSFYSRGLALDEGHGIIINAGYYTMFAYTYTPSYSLTCQSQTSHSIGCSAGLDIARIDDTHFLLFGSSASSCFVKTYSYNYAANTITEIDSETIQASKAYGLTMKKVNGFYCISYGDGSGNAMIKTVSVDGSYNITIIDTLVAGDDRYEDTTVYDCIDRIDDNHLVKSYVASNSTIKIKTIYIDNNGGNLEVYKEYEITDNYGAHHGLCANSNKQAIVFYNGLTSEDLESLVLDIDIADDFNLEAKEEQLTGGFTPELEILRLKFAGETFPIIAAYSLPLESKMSVKRRLLSSVTVNKQIKSKAIPKILKSELVE